MANSKLNLKEITFTQDDERPDLEYIGGAFNVAFKGVPVNEKRIRKFILGKFEELNLSQLICLYRDEEYSTVIGADV